MRSLVNSIKLIVKKEKTFFFNFYLFLLVLSLREKHVVAHKKKNGVTWDEVFLIVYFRTYSRARVKASKFIEKVLNVF